MNVNELMVGDWVRIVDDDTDEIYETKVAGISGNLGNIYAPIPEYGETAYPFGEDCVEPIPLTLAILEKNFEKKTLYGIFDDYFDLEIREYNDGIYVATYHSCEMNVPDEQMVLSYVHELQHFLRHCGIDKNIEL